MLLLLAVSCGEKKKASAVKVQDPFFPMLQIPSAYAEQEERIEYTVMHYWDGFFREDGKTDSARVLGIRKAEVEQALANYIAVLNQAPLPLAQKGMSRMFDALSAKQISDTSARVYLAMTEMVSLYLYDPNSPLRDEDLYLPFVERMAASPLTGDDMRTACRYEAQMCSLNPRGSVAPDFAITLSDGSRVRMHSVKAERAILFFSNPGCTNCKEIIEALEADENVRAQVSSGRLAVLNVYVDEDIKAWRSYMPIYPREWVNGYDAAHILRKDGLYCIRAIPSLYLLDESKRILLKDAPVERVLQAL